LDAVTEYPEALVLEVFSSDFVDENRFLKHLGGGKNDPDAVTRYLSLPIASRPDISFFFDREYIPTLRKSGKIPCQPLLRRFMLRP
jgi:hypothetical protein